MSYFNMNSFYLLLLYFFGTHYRTIKILCMLYYKNKFNVSKLTNKKQNKIVMNHCFQHLPVHNESNLSIFLFFKWFFNIISPIVDQLI